MSEAEKTRAILLRKTRLTETSLILSWITPSQGRFQTVAKGALRPKSRLAGVLDLFHTCDLHFQRARSGSLHSLREATLVETFPALRADYPRLALASYAVELIEKATELETPVPEFYDLLQRALRYLNREPASRKALRHLESECVRLLGIASPSLPPERTLERHLHRLPVSRQTLELSLPPQP